MSGPGTKRATMRLNKALYYLELAVASGHLKDRHDWTPPCDAMTRARAACYLIKEAIKMQDVTYPWSP